MPLPERTISSSAAETEWLATRDGRMAWAISLIGPISRSCRPDPFSGLVHAITGQQISGQAHASIWNRLISLLGVVEPASLLACTESELRSCGLSTRKIEYIHAIAAAFQGGKLNAEKLCQMEDKELYAKLTSLRGIGPWTVEMLLIFTFARKNIISFADLGIRRGLMRLHDLRELDEGTFQSFRQLYAPCNTAASLYLWEIAALKCWPPASPASGG